MKAASRGSPIVAVLANNNINDTPKIENANASPMMIYISVSNSAGQVYRIDDHIFMFATGLMVRKIVSRIFGYLLAFLVVTTTDTICVYICVYI
jgi:hypothetical protein